MKNKQHNCGSCPIRAKYDNAPKSFVGRFWRWHINFCPGWKSYFKSLDPEIQADLQQKYQLKKH